MFSRGPSQSQPTSVGNNCTLLRGTKGQILYHSSFIFHILGLQVTPVYDKRTVCIKCAITKNEHPEIPFLSIYYTTIYCSTNSIQIDVLFIFALVTLVCPLFAKHANTALLVLIRIDTVGL